MTGKSDRIQQLVDDPDLKQAFINVREYLVDMFLRADSEDGTALMDIRRRINSLDAVEKDLKLAIEDGHFEDLRAAEEEET